MAWTPMYLEKEDVEILNTWLNENEEIAFLVSNGSGKWIAKKQLDIFAESELQMAEVRLIAEDLEIQTPYSFQYNLWHIPSGKLPLIDTSINRFIDDPWSGWTEIRAGANRGVPYFGAGHVGIISLNIHLAYNNGAIPISHFGWIGNHYKVIGNGAEKSTELFWNKLKRMVKKVAVQIPRCNRLETKKEVFAFPSAYSEISNGRPCSSN